MIVWCGDRRYQARYNGLHTSGSEFTGMCGVPCCLAFSTISASVNPPRGRDLGDVFSSMCETQGKGEKGEKREILSLRSGHHHLHARIDPPVHAPCVPIRVTAVPSTC
jgi:hypothetical protein